MLGEFEMQINPESVSHSSSVESQRSAVPATLPVSPLIIHSLISPAAFPLFFYIAFFSFLPSPNLDYAQRTAGFFFPRRFLFVFDTKL